ncbi:hypothetical protein EYB45_03385 [Erythrobacteraceae bacterium CFH 75059]|uniref:energy transducer TonB n=1 Tax=Qipengyuania thermophila TaxID=2509361 RepID=UPI00102292A1|nr:energy transducer TonB [Qipengyuania thermophila]TCD06742.1 hypothetical protein EYB45_03385 [Erythrobacteraceae bacterium CFH 75059]
MHAWAMGAAVLSVIASGAKAEEVVLSPSSAWVLDYGDHRCRMTRAFGEGPTRTAFMLEQTQPSDTFSWTVAGPLVDRFGKGKVQVQFAPAFDGFEIDHDASLRVAEFGTAVASVTHEAPPPTLISRTAKPRLRSEPDALSDGTARAARLRLLNPEHGRSIARLTLTKGGESVSLSFGSLEAPFKAMNACMDDLLVSWGMDPAELREATTAARWINSVPLVGKIQEFYPAKALEEGAEADYRLRVVVGANGRVSRCHMILLSRGSDFAQRVCDIMRREARFEPGRNAAGEPKPAFFSTKISYRVY